MPSLFIWGGRGLFFALIVAQCFLLASYPAQYTNNSRWYVVAVSYVPSLVPWTLLVLFQEAKLRRLFYIWGLYVCGLVFSIAFVFEVVGDSLDKERFLGPNVLKATFCFTPLLLLLLLNTASDASEYKDVVFKLCVQMTIDLFDAVEMLDIVLDEKEHNYGIPKGFGVVMIVLACLSFLLSPWQMAENDLDEEKPRRCTAILRNIVEMVVINFAFLIVRLVIFFEYKKDESIFIAKNGIAIILSIIEIRDLRHPI